MPVHIDGMSVRPRATAAAGLGFRSQGRAIVSLSGLLLALQAKTGM
jgi:hypothetical protein